MNLIYGSNSPDAVERLTQTAERRYPDSSRLDWGRPEPFIEAIRKTSSDPVGLYQEDSVSVAIIGLINHGPSGLSQTAERDAQCAFDEFSRHDLQGLGNLQGQFLVAVSDSANHRLILYPDPSGLRTAYYHQNDETVRFSTNLGTLAEALAGDIEINEAHENFFLSHGFFPFNGTMFDRIQLIPPQHALIVDQDGLRLQKIVKANAQPPTNDLNHDVNSMDEDAIIEYIDQAFQKAITDQLSPDKKVGVLLGGFDSALVAAYLAKAGKEVHTYSFYYEDSRYNQAHTDTVADHIGSTHHWIPVNAKTIADGIRTFDRYFNSPTNWLNYVIQTEAVCRMIREDGIRHVYSGDGCDAAFLGYPRVHTTSVLFNRLGRWPKGLVHFLTRVLDSAVLENTVGRSYTVLLHLIRTLGRDMPERGFLTFRIFDGNSVRHLKAPNYQSAETSDEALLTRIAAPLKGKSPDRIAYGGKGFLSPNRSKMIGSSDSTGVVIQAPYLNPDFKSLATSLPDELCRPKGSSDAKETGKYILMRMAEKKGYLPREAIYQKKFAAVDAPVDKWLKCDFRDEGMQFLKDLPFPPNQNFCEALFEEKLIEKLHRKFVASDSITTHGLSLLLTYSRFTRFLHQ